MTTTASRSLARRTRAQLLLVIGCALVVTACGSTRFVVVENDAASAAPAAPAAPAGPTSAEDDQAIRDAVEGAIGLDGRSFAERTEYLDGAEDLGDTYASVLKLVADLDASIRIDEVAADGAAATATITVVVAGADYAAGVPVELVRKDGAWKVTRAGACAALAIGSPCPEG